MKRLILGAALLTLAACNAPAPTQQQAALSAGEATSASVGCVAHARSVWNPDAATQLSITAFAEGPTCQNAVAVLVVRGADGGVLHTDVHQTEFVMLLNGKATPQDLDAALAEWIKIDPATTADLPAWDPKAETPVSGEFPFYPAEGVDRAAYETLRGQKLPMLCYVQGMESSACYVFRDGAFTDLGVQSFPG